MGSIGSPVHIRWDWGTKGPATLTLNPRHKCPHPSSSRSGPNRPRIRPRILVTTPQHLITQLSAYRGASACYLQPWVNALRATTGIHLLAKIMALGSKTKDSSRYPKPRSLSFVQRPCPRGLTLQSPHVALHGRSILPGGRPGWDPEKRLAFLRVENPSQSRAVCGFTREPGKWQSRPSFQMPRFLDLGGGHWNLSRGRWGSLKDLGPEAGLLQRLGQDGDAVHPPKPPPREAHEPRWCSWGDLPVSFVSLLLAWDF